MEYSETTAKETINKMKLRIYTDDSQIYFEFELTSSELNRNPSLLPVFIRENWIL